MKTNITAASVIKTTTAVVIFTTLLISCSANEETLGDDVTSSYIEQPIRFSATSISSRTVFGNSYTNILWEVGDSVIIESDSAGTGTEYDSDPYRYKRALYVVKSGQNNGIFTYFDIPDGEYKTTYGLRWSEETKYRFRAISPASVVEKPDNFDKTNNWKILNAYINIPATQTCEVESDENNVEVLPDMSHNVMLGQTEKDVYVERQAEAINLNFSPLSTLLEVTFINTSQETFNISKVALHMDEDQNTTQPYGSHLLLNGKYEYRSLGRSSSGSIVMTEIERSDIQTEEKMTTTIDFKNNDNTESDKNIVDSSNDDVVVKLQPNATMKVRFFMLLPRLAYKKNSSTPQVKNYLDSLELSSNPITLTLTLGDGTTKSVTAKSGTLYKLKANYAKVSIGTTPTDVIVNANNSAKTESMTQESEVSGTMQ